MPSQRDTDGPLNHHLVLARRPTKTLVDDDDFRLEGVPVPTPREGEVLVKVKWLSMDPAQRGWLDDAPSYLPPVGLGEVVRGSGAGEVVASRDPELPVGMSVTGGFGWQEYAIARRSGPSAPAPLRAVPEGVDPAAALNVLGVTGLAAYFGMHEIGRPGVGEIVLVSGAGGAAGGTAAQIAKLAGARVVGIAGGARKCEWLIEAAGLDAAIDYREGELEARIREVAGEGVDLFYDNVGGAILDAGLANIASGGRIVIGGAMASRYPVDDRPPPGVVNLPLLMIRSARMEGFTLVSFAGRFAEAHRALAGWLTAGNIVSRQDVREGSLLDAPATFRRLFKGENLGKQLLALVESPPADGHPQ